MPDEKKSPPEIKALFEKSPDYRIIAANGLWGHVTPRGDFLMDFVVESQKTPQSITHRVIEGQAIGEEVKRDPPTIQLVRQLEVGVLMSVENAEAVANFIKERIAEYRKLQVKVQ